MVQARQTAYKVWISDLVNSVFEKGEGQWDPHFFLVNGKKISRVNIIANVVNKYDSEGYSYVDLDDGSGMIRAKLWSEDVKFIKNVEVGNLVLVVGRSKKFNEEIYLIPEIIKVLDNNVWAKVRRKELEREYGEPKKVVNVSNSKMDEKVEVVSESARQKILGLIGKKDEISYDDLMKDSDVDDKEVETIINELVREGEIYMPRPGIIRLI